MKPGGAGLASVNVRMEGIRMLDLTNLLAARHAAACSQQGYCQ